MSEIFDNLNKWEKKMGNKIAVKEIRNENLAIHLKQSPLTNRELASLIGIDVVTIYRILSNKHKPSKQAVEGLCKYLQATPRELGLDWYYDL